MPKIPPRPGATRKAPGRPPKPDAYRSVTLRAPPDLLDAYRHAAIDLQTSANDLFVTALWEAWRSLPTSKQYTVEEPQIAREIRGKLKTR